MSICERADCENEVARLGRRFCSRSCSALVTKNYTFNARRPRFCATCGTQFSDGRRRYCTEECKQIAMYAAGRQRPLQDLLIENSPVPGGKIKKRLIASGLLAFECSVCKITEWLGKPAPLQIDHISGNSRDNRLVNLRLLCANCHAQTDTFCGKNVRKRRQNKSGSASG